MKKNRKRYRGRIVRRLERFSMDEEGIVMITMTRIFLFSLALFMVPYTWAEVPFLISSDVQPQSRIQGPALEAPTNVDSMSADKVDDAIVNLDLQIKNLKFNHDKIWVGLPFDIIGSIIIGAALFDGAQGAVRYDSLSQSHIQDDQIFGAFGAILVVGGIYQDSRRILKSRQIKRLEWRRENLQRYKLEETEPLLADHLYQLRTDYDENVFGITPNYIFGISGLAIGALSWGGNSYPYTTEAKAISIIFGSLGAYCFAGGVLHSWRSIKLAHEIRKLEKKQSKLMGLNFEEVTPVVLANGHAFGLGINIHF